jgi:hypothetical protein
MHVLRNEHVLRASIRAMSEPSPSTRLLYRGAISLPDSLIRLDGLTFTTSHSNKLLTNPLALALESMRGRPCLRFLAVCSLHQLSIDEVEDEGAVFVYVCLQSLTLVLTLFLRVQGYPRPSHTDSSLL